MPVVSRATPTRSTRASRAWWRPGWRGRSRTGTYLHGISASGAVRRSLLAWLAARAGRPAHPGWGEAGARPRRWDRLADVVVASVDVKTISRLVGRAL